MEGRTGRKDEKREGRKKGRKKGRTPPPHTCIVRNTNTLRAASVRNTSTVRTEFSRKYQKGAECSRKQNRVR